MDRNLWRTFPCIRGRKEPAIADWENAARPGYGTEQAGASYGVACGPSGLVVVDCDVDKVTGEYVGLVNFLTLCADNDYFPDTFQVTTPSGGVHFYFGACAAHEVRNRAKRITLDGRARPFDGVDVRGSGGYVLGPGSSGRGRRYEITNDTATAPLPEWLCAALRRPETRDLTGKTFDANAYHFTHDYGERALENEVRILLATPEGGRNHQLYTCARLLGELVASGVLAGRRVVTALEAAAHAIGLEPREIRSTLTSGLRTGLTQPRTGSRIR